MRLSPTKMPTVTHSARHESPRSSEVRRSVGAAGRSCSTEQRHVWSCLGAEQQARVDSLGWLQHTPQHNSESHRWPFNSHALVAGTTPAQTNAAISAIEELVFVTGRNITNTPFCMSSTPKLSCPDSNSSSFGPPPLANYSRTCGAESPRNADAGQGQLPHVKAMNADAFFI